MLYDVYPGELGWLSTIIMHSSPGHACVEGDVVVVVGCLTLIVLVLRQLCSVNLKRQS